MKSKYLMLATTMLGTVNVIAAADISHEVPGTLPPLGVPGNFQLPAPTHTVRIKPELAGVHPRLILNAAGLEALRNKIKDPKMVPVMEGFLTNARKLAGKEPPVNPPNTEDPFRGFGGTLSSLALAYLLTNDPYYLQAAKKWIHAVNHYPSWAGNEDLGASHICFGMSLAYDWLYNDLTPDERREIETSLHAHGKILLHRGFAPEYIGKWWGGIYFQNHFWINNTGVAAVAAALYDRDPGEYQRWLDQTRSAFQTTYKHLGVDGGYHEGPAYARYGITWLINYIELLRSISGEDLSDMRQLKGVVPYFCHTMMPNWKSLANFGDAPPDGWPKEKPVIAGHNPDTGDAPGIGYRSGGPIDNEMLAYLAARFRDGHAEWLRKKNRAAFNANYYDSAFDIIWYDPSVEPKPLDDLPLMGLYQDIGLAIFRSSWQDNAAVIAFQCGPPGGLHAIKQWKTFPHPVVGCGHSHPDANSFLFWADSDYRIADPGSYTHFKSTHNENVWIAGGKGQRGEAKWFDGRSYYINDIPQAHLVKAMTSPAADYVEGEASPAYEPDCKLTQFRRRLLFVKKTQPYVVVYDTLEASIPQTFTSCLHSFYPFQILDASSFAADSKGLAGGSVFGPDGFTMSAAPLTVIANDKPVRRGFELNISPKGQTNSTWMVTVIGIGKQNVRLLSPAPAPKLQIGGDIISWDANGEVSFNGQLISNNRMAITPTEQ